MAKWRCVKFCGACCHLDPRDRPDLASYLSTEELVQYLRMVGEDGWCVHFDQSQRICTIYDDRPSFCRVTPQNFHDRFGVPRRRFDEFANECCIEQIGGVYGDGSLEMLRFRQGL
jgi:Fe-S-cluster containining protein